MTWCLTELSVSFAAMRMHQQFMFLLALTGAACGTATPGGMSGPTMNNKVGEVAAPVPVKSPVISADILAREPVSNRASVHHILIGWKDLADAYGGRVDSRAADRTKADAEHEVTMLLGQLKGGADFMALMKAHSEDSASTASGAPIVVTPDAQLVIEFRQMALRLKPGEIGVCESDFGFHIIRRDPDDN